jgi:geranylgeranyl transferase type-2 subunit alpha
MPEADWTREMMIVEGYLERDGRNFHSWDYRRYLISSILSLPPPIVEDGQGEKSRKEMKKPTTRSELNYTTQKISSNFSNFSAWHYRTKLLIKLWDEEAKEGKGVEEKEKKIESEFDLVKQAMWSDPNDQSAWLYHRWLVGKGISLCLHLRGGFSVLTECATGTIPIVRREIQGIEELLEEEPDSRWSLDSLIYYKKLLKALLLSSPTSVNLDQEILELDSDRTEMLKKLQLVDPMRKNRYEDLSKSSRSPSFSLCIARLKLRRSDLAVKDLSL